MSERHASMMEPPVEELLERVDSKFTLVSLAAMRGRQINSYFNQLGEGLGSIVPPQVTSVSRKPLSISLEEIAAGKITYTRIDPLAEGEDGGGEAEPDQAGEEPVIVDVAGALAGRRIVLGVSGGIAAYKAIEVCRRLVDAGAWVSPVMTAGATRFVGETTLSALASERVRRSLWDEPEPIPHTRLGQGADLIIVAPATARVIGAYAAGISSDLLTATLLATRAPVLVCPAMHTEMWEHPAVADNIDTLRRRGVHIVEPGRGRLAGGDVGTGRLADPADIVAAAASILVSAADMTGVSAVVTAGGTREPIDPVRYIGNRSSGKQGYAIAAELARRGAAVTLISTVSRPTPAGVTVISVETAGEMEAAVASAASQATVVVMAAAVADFRPKVTAPAKIKKSEGPPEIVLEPTPDILAGLGRERRPGQVVVGFAAETVTSHGQSLRDHALSKLATKGADLIVANDVAAPGVGFAHDTNAVLIVGRSGFEAEVPLSDKQTVATAVVDAIASLITPEQEKHEQS
ncbi:MAG TPA: bifunctional phosphopantothenoylcysteine decarboxylase/phosphopantothenate--cysteine ligase CoaBC [Acidimicrobiales bacterium]|nr:bifunctional phosphopantothenoylcysteine decarboxylase/phosphopantothenate--cysteine ligase CoaBC [Acidimicrobiales bacterium]